MISFSDIFVAALIILPPLYLLRFIDIKSCEQPVAPPATSDIDAVSASWELVPDDADPFKVTELPGDRRRYAVPVYTECPGVVTISA